MLERIVHLLDDDDGDLPAYYQLLEISAPDDVAVINLNAIAQTEWRETPWFTRQLGDRWLASSETPLARVPSAVAPRTHNYLLNLEHPDATKVKIEASIRERFDNRLFHFGAG